MFVWYCWRVCLPMHWSIFVRKQTGKTWIWTKLSQRSTIIHVSVNFYFNAETHKSASSTWGICINDQIVSIEGKFFNTHFHLIRWLNVVRWFWSVFSRVVCQNCAHQHIKLWKHKGCLQSNNAYSFLEWTEVSDVNF